MAKMTVTKIDGTVYKTRSKNDAYCTAGEHAQENNNAPVGAKIFVMFDEKVTLTYEMVERINIWNEKVKEWKIFT